MYSLITDGTCMPCLRALRALGFRYIEGNFLAIVISMCDNGSYVWAMLRRNGDEESNYLFDCVCVEWCFVC